MSTSILITVNDITLKAKLLETACASAISAVLPIEVVPERWGDEFYFDVPVNMPLDETASSIVKIGDIGYWPPGRALAIFFGPTPMSTGPDPVPASAVNIVGKITDDASLLKKVKGTPRIKIEKMP